VRLRLVAAVVVALGLLLAAGASGQSPPAPTFDRGEPDKSIADGSAQRKLDRARRRWRRARIHNYRFELNRICFCVPGGPVVVFVRNDRPVKQAIDDEVAYRVDNFWRGTKGRGGPDAPVAPGPTPR
jgi:hypothetical protein